LLAGPLSGAPWRAGATSDCTILGTPSNDVLNGTSGDDVICGVGGDDVLRGNGGKDRLLGGDGDDRLQGGAGNDKLRGDRGKDVLEGGGGDDNLRGGAGPDSIAGGPGSDLADYLNSESAVTLSIGDGAGDGSRGERDNIRGDVENLRGGEGNDTLRGNGGANWLHGYEGRDTVRGGAGNDRLYGGDGRDSLDARDSAAFTDGVYCGNGAGDSASADTRDDVGADCENVNQNHAPTDILLSATSIGENEPAASTVGTLSATDEDSGDTHTYSLATGLGDTDNGSFAVAGSALRTNAAFDYEAKRSYSLRLQVMDGEGASFQKSFTVAVTDKLENRSPVAVDDTVTATEDTQLQLPVSGLGSPAANDTDPDSNPLTVSAVSAATGGSVSLSGGQISFDPTANLCGAGAGFDYTVSDGQGGTDVGHVTLTITCTPDDPTVGDDTATVAEDAAPTTIDVLANDDDPDGEPVTIDSVTSAANGTVAITNAGADLTYEPDGDFCGSDSFTYTVLDGPTATVDVTVTCVNDPPVVTAATVTLAENSANGTVVHTVAFTDVESTQNHAFAITAGNTGGAFAIDPTTGAITVANSSALDFETTPSFALTVQVTDDGAPPESGTATITVDLTDTGEPPVVDPATFTVAENTAAATTVGTVTFTDPDAGQTHTFAITAGNTGNTFAINAGTGTITVAQPPDFEATPSYSLTVEVTDNGTPALSGTATVTVNVSNVNEAPSITAPATVSANRDVARVVAGIAVADPDAGDIELTLAADDGTIDVDETASAADVTGDGTDTVVITGTVAEINAILAATNGVVYLNDAGFLGATDTLHLDVDDLGSPALTASATVTIQFNQPPVAADLTPSTNEDTPVAVPLSATDGDDDDLTFSIVTGPANGSLGAIGPVDCTTTPNTCTAQVTYTPNDDFNGGDQFSYEADDGADTDTGTVDITVDAVNDAPAITLSGSTPSFTEGGAAATVDGGLTVVDVDDTNLVSGTVSITAGLVAGDLLAFTPAGGITDTNPAPDVLALSGTATVADWQSVLRSVQFSSTSDNPTNATRTVSFVVNDGDVDSNTAQKSVAVVPVNDAPVLIQPDAAALDYTENAAPTAIAPNITAADVDSTDLVSATIDLGAGYVDGQDVLSLGTNPQNGITAGAFDAANGTLTLTGSSSVANYQTALRDVRFANTSDNPTAGNRTVTFQVDDGPGPNDLSNVVSRNVNVIPANDPPAAGDDSFTGANGALANTRLAVGTTTTGPHLAVSGSVLDNDADPDTPLGLTAGPTTISSANCAGCNNVALNANGTFTYDPPAGFTGTDTFTYTVNDNDPEAPPNQTDTATVSIQVFGPVVWYVDVDAAAPPAGQGGRSHSPFQSLAPLTTGGAADALDGAGDVIFLGVDSSPPVAAYDGGIVLEASQRLLGEPFGLSIDPGGPGVGPGVQNLVAPSGNPDPATNPNVRNSAVGGIGIGLADGVEIQRVNAGITGAGSATGISGTGVSTATIGSNLLVQGNTAGLSLSGADGGNISVAATITGNTGTAVNVANRSSGTVTFSGNITGSSANSAVTLASNAGANVDFTGAVNLNSTAAGVTAFSASGGGTITADNAANQVASFAGTGINLNGVNLGAAGVTFNTVSSAVGGAANGILLTGVGGAGAFSANGGAITATARGLDVDGGSGSVTVGTSLTTSGAAARSVEVTNRTGGTVDLNGLVTESSQGINLSTNGIGLVRFDGGVVASTGANPAFSATVSGNVAVTDPNAVGTAPDNTLTTGTGTALNVENTNIHADDLTFRSISSNGAASGIVLNGTGASGGLTVTGNGGTCSTAGNCTGGAIQATTGVGISLASTEDVDLTRMFIGTTGSHGVSGTAMSDPTADARPTFGFHNGFMESPGDGDNESALFFDTLSATNITGQMVVENSTIQNFEDVGVHVGNVSGTLDLDVTGMTIDNNSDSNGEEGVDVDASGTATINVDVSGSRFEELEGGSMNIVSQGSGAIDMNITNNVDIGAGGPDNFPTPPVMTFSSEGTSSNFFFDITGNTLVDAPGDGIFIGHEGEISGRVNNNTITGITLGDGIRIDTDTAGNQTSTIEIDNNIIGGAVTFESVTYSGLGDDGIQVLHRDGTKTLNLTITDNTIVNTGSEAIRYFSDDDVSGGGPTNRVKTTGNTFGNNGTVDTSDSIVVISQDPGTEVCTDTSGNTTVEGITLQQSLSAVLAITQASTAALATANGGATVTPAGTITFSTPCAVPPPTNP
jgi:hypothetical protein